MPWNLAQKLIHSHLVEGEAKPDADIAARVDTEQGVAELTGRTVGERADSLIASAHRDFRGSLRQSWRSRVVVEDR